MKKVYILFPLLLFNTACTPYVGKLLEIEPGMDKSKVKRIIGNKPEYIKQVNENFQTYEVWEYRLSDYEGSIRGMETSYGIYLFYFSKDGKLLKYGNRNRGYRGSTPSPQTPKSFIKPTPLHQPPITSTFIAVVDFRGNNISEGDCRALTDRLRTELFNTKYFKVIEREMMEQIIEEQGFQQSGCSTDECMVEVGKLVGVEKIIGGSISQVGNIFSVSARIVNVETGEIENTGLYDHTGNIGELLTGGMKKVAVELIK